MSFQSDYVLNVKGLSTGKVLSTVKKEYGSVVNFKLHKSFKVNV